MGINSSRQRRCLLGRGRRNLTHHTDGQMRRCGLHRGLDRRWLTHSAELVRAIVRPGGSPARGCRIAHYGGCSTCSQTIDLVGAIVRPVGSSAHGRLDATRCRWIHSVELIGTIVGPGRPPSRVGIATSGGRRLVGWHWQKPRIGCRYRGSRDAIPAGGVVVAARRGTLLHRWCHWIRGRQRQRTAR